MPSAPLNRRTFLKQASLLPVAVTGLGLGAPSLLSAAEPVKRSSGPKLKLSLNAFSFNDALLAGLAGKAGGVSLFDVLDFCATQDFEAIDPTGYYFPGYPEVPQREYLNKFKRRAFQLGLDISGTGIRNDFAQPDAEKRADDVKRAKAWIEAAAELGAPVLRVFAGAVPKSYENRWAEAAAWMIDALRECAEHGQKHGIMVGVQNHGDMLRSADECLKVVEAVNSDWFGVIVDTGNMLVTDPYADIARVVPYAVNWQIKENLGAGKPVDLARLLRVIRDGGYRGYVPIETLAINSKSYDAFKIVPAFAQAVRAALNAV